MMSDAPSPIPNVPNNSICNNSATSSNLLNPNASTTSQTALGMQSGNATPGQTTIPVMHYQLPSPGQSATLGSANTSPETSSHLLGQQPVFVQQHPQFIPVQHVPQGAQVQPLPPGAQIMPQHQVHHHQQHHFVQQQPQYVPVQGPNGQIQYIQVQPSPVAYAAPPQGFAPANPGQQVVQLQGLSSTPSAQARADPNNASNVSLRSQQSAGSNNNSMTELKGATQLIVNYLSPVIDDAKLYELFSRYGKVTRSRVIYDRTTGQTKGYGFVYFDQGQEAERAIKHLNGFELYGKWLKVSPAVPQRPEPK